MAQPDDYQKNYKTTPYEDNSLKQKLEKFTIQEPQNMTQASAGRELTFDEKVKLFGEIDDRRKLLAFHELLCDQARSIMDKKNSDYGARTDPFRNFHGFGAFGILVRKSDKMARLRTFLEKLERGENMAVIDESWLDTLLDDINYAILLAGYVKTFGAQK